MPSNLNRFLKSYLSWKESGAKNEEPFFRNKGLCHNLLVWCEVNGLSYRTESLALKAAFVESGRNPLNPFGPSSNIFEDKCDCSSRLSWIATVVHR